MHDIDRALFEQEQWSGETGYETGEQETGYETGYESAYETYEVFGESSDSRETELAAELLEVSSEAELDRFIGNWLGKAVSAAKNFASSDVGKAVGGVLKGVAKQALPQLGQIAGDFVAPGAGGSFGAKAGGWLASKLELGLELEGLSAEDREFETAKALVRFGEETAQRAAQAASTSPGAPPLQVARTAAVAAARSHLPGLAQAAAGQQAPGKPAGNGSGNGKRSSGQWVRRGHRIVLLDVG
jgi:hypothetical protein